MANKVLPIKCEIVESESNVKVGSGKRDTNKIVVTVTNTSAESISFSGLGAKGTFSIAISIGKGPEDLVATSDESTAITIQAPDNWQPNPYKNRDGQATWSYRLPKPVLAGNETAKFTLTKFVSHTDPGKAKITIGAKISGYDEYKTTLEVEKKAEQLIRPSLLYG